MRVIIVFWIFIILLAFLFNTISLLETIISIVNAIICLLIISK